MKILDQVGQLGAFTDRLSRFLDRAEIGGTIDLVLKVGIFLCLMTIAITLWNKE